MAAYENITLPSGSSHLTLTLHQFLADRTNGRAIATLLRLSSVVVCRL